jgi:xylulokinase
LFLHAGPTQAGGAALAWLCDALRLSIEEALALAATAPAGAGGLLFTPHLLGERAPLWDIDVRGTFVGLSSDHTTAHLCRAVLEGVAFSARHLLEALEIGAGTFPLEMRASGGGSQSDLWCQIKANALNTTLARLKIRHSGCVGAALMAASGAGLAASVAEAAEENVQVEREFEPTSDRAIYDELYGVYRGLYEALKPTYAALAAIRRDEPVART